MSAAAACSATIRSSKAGIGNDLSTHGLEANAIKTCVTDLMQQSAQSLLQLVGAKGYRLNHIAGRALVDSRPFQIFEGSNDILYIQIAETLLKQLQRSKQRNLSQFLTMHELTERAMDRLNQLLDFEVNLQLPQRKLLELGRVFSRITTMSLVAKLEETSFNKELIESSLVNLQQEIRALLSGFRAQNSTEFVEDYQAGKSWFECLDHPA